MSDVNVSVVASKKQIENQTIELASKFVPPVGFLGSFKAKRQLTKFNSPPGFESFRCELFGDGHERVSSVQPSDKLRLFQDGGFFARVNSKPVILTLWFADLTDSNGDPFCLTLDGVWQIKNGSTFLRKYGLQRLQLFRSIETTSLESEIVQQIKLRLASEIAEESYSFEDLKDENALPSEWFKSNLPKWLPADFDWLELVSVQDPVYASEIAARRSEDGQRKKLQELERESMRSHREHQSELDEIEHSAELSEQQRSSNLIVAKQNAELAKLQHEQEKARLLAEIERQRKGDEIADELLASFETFKRDSLHRLDALETAKKDSVRIDQQATDFQLAGIDVKEKERLNVAAANISTATLESLGKTSSPAFLAQAMREKAASNPSAILIKKVEIMTRDIGSRKIDTLAINSSLTFEFMSKRAGYATILNIGTSNTVSLHSPNAYVSNTRIDAKQKIKIPGEMLIPRSQLELNGLDYVEMGPPGWEELVVIVSDERLFDDADLFAANRQNPFPTISQDRVNQLLDTLIDYSEESWDVGVLSFLVE